MGLIDTSLEVLKLASKIANPELVQAATRANIDALELSGKNLELRQPAEELENQVKELKVNCYSLERSSERVILSSVRVNSVATVRGAGMSNANSST